MEDGTTLQHKFLEDSAMTFVQVFDFAYGNLVPLMHSLEAEFGEDHFAEALKRAAYESALKSGEDTAGQLKCADFTAYTALLREPSHFGRHVLTAEIVEDSPHAMAVKITECLWATTFREMGAADLGYLLICHRDYADCQGFNPRITLERSKTLMQGDEYCNHRFVWEE